ncbi:MAG TPA: DUF4149 domain-containing protein [Candidatus Deferrimicrobiaceae bacterium]|jgi:uncharacterized membrane protein
MLASAVYRLGLSLWVGGMALFTFIVTPVIFRTQGRDAAGKIVGAIFPLYFRYGLALTAVALLARVIAGEAFHGIRQWAGTILILTALLLSGYQAYGVAPKMERVKQSVASFETAPPDDPARKEFSRLHGISMVVNLVVLLEGAALIVAYETFRR